MTSYDKESPETIQEMFGSIAKRYDRANAVQSFLLHRLWNKELIRQVTEERSPASILDLCCGTGDIALGYLKGSAEPKKAVMLDFCAEMLECARLKSAEMGLERHEITYIQADAQHIPLPDATVACTTIAYGIRNVQDPLQCLREAYRVLEPGGVLGILELTRPRNPIVRVGHQLYLKTVLPLVGKWMTSNPDAYKYLCRSILHFIPPDSLEGMLHAAGFHSTSRTSLAGGIATIFVGYK